MKVSSLDYLKMLEELMYELEFKEDLIVFSFIHYQKGLLSLKNLSANVAIQCFVKQHSSVNSDLVRQYLIEFQKNNEVTFNDSISS